MLMISRGGGAGRVELAFDRGPVIRHMGIRIGGGNGKLLIFETTCRSPPAKSGREAKTYTYCQNA
jgi:hypothetical protein